LNYHLPKEPVNTETRCPRDKCLNSKKEIKKLTYVLVSQIVEEYRCPIITIKLRHNPIKVNACWYKTEKGLPQMRQPLVYDILNFS